MRAENAWARASARAFWPPAPVLTTVTFASSPSRWKITPVSQTLSVPAFAATWMPVAPSPSPGAAKRVLETTSNPLPGSSSSASLISASILAVAFAALV